MATSRSDLSPVVAAGVLLVGAAFVAGCSCFKKGDDDDDDDGLVGHVGAIDQDPTPTPTPEPSTVAITWPLQLKDSSAGWLNLLQATSESDQSTTRVTLTIPRVCRLEPPCPENHTSANNS